jgi:hypothetical protein
MGVWAFFDIALLGSGVMAIVFSILWRKPDILLNMVISPMDLTAGLAMGIALVATFVVSIGAVVQRNHVTMGFVILNWFLVVDVFIVAAVGTVIWWYTLRERDNFHQEWIKTDKESRLFMQDKFSCCGYEFSNDTAEVGGSFCTSQDFINNLNATNVNNFCITAITTFADDTLNHIFTVVYGFMALVIGLFLASMCVIKKREEDERFKKIDAKRGGRGFV